MVEYPFKRWSWRTFAESFCRPSFKKLKKVKFDFAQCVCLILELLRTEALKGQDSVCSFFTIILIFFSYTEKKNLRTNGETVRLTSVDKSSLMRSFPVVSSVRALASLTADLYFSQRSSSRTMDPEWPRQSRPGSGFGWSSLAPLLGCCGPQWDSQAWTERAHCHIR